MGYYDQSFAKDDTLFLSIKDANNNTNSTYRAIKVLSNPAISSGLDKIVCPDVLTKLKGKTVIPEFYPGIGIKTAKT